jgi:uncharacterized protein YukE
VIAAILREELTTVDNDAAMRIVANCRAKAPDASPREFDLLGGSLAQRLKTIRSVENPVTMMITRLSRSFEGNASETFVTRSGSSKSNRSGDANMRSTTLKNSKR